MRIDLHVHSTASDGTFTPADVVTYAAKLEIDVLGLTDHDSAAGWDEAAAAARREGVTLVRGLEISTKMRGAGVHVLAYLPDLTYPPLAAELQKILAGRDGRLGTMVSQLRAAGVDITEADVRRQAFPSPAIGRPHIADVLVSKGVVADRGEAFGSWLSYGMPGYVDRYASQTATMVRLVREAGGAPVIAHPWGRGSARVLDRAALQLLRDDGLAGIEVEHQDHRPADRMALGTLASDLGLVATGSSDFHGAGKVNHDLGCNLTEPAEFERLLEAAAANAAAAGRTVPEVVVPMNVVNATLMGESFITLFVIMDPPGAIPLFLSLTHGMTPKQRKVAAWQAVVVAFCVIVAFAVFGRQILSYLDISLPALQGAGGLLLLLVALELLTGREQDVSANRDVNVALVPLGTPLLAGPGAIVATMVLAERVDDSADFVALAAGVIGVHLVLWAMLRYSTVIVRVLHEGGITLVTRISGLLLSAIAVQLIADSVRAFVAGEG